MPTYRGCDGALLHDDVLGDPGARPQIVLAGGAARHLEKGPFTGISVAAYPMHARTGRGRRERARTEHRAPHHG